MLQTPTRRAKAFQGSLRLYLQASFTHNAHSHRADHCLVLADKIQQAITPQVCAELAARGYAVVNGVFGAAITHQLQQEVKHVHQSGLMHLNHTHLVNKGQTHLLAKSQIQEAELKFDPAVQQAAPLMAQLNADTTLRTMLSLFIPQLRLEEQAVKLQYNEGGGGCFPMHFDSDEQLDGRRVTAICYLNDNWQPSHGGQLRLYPFPAPPVDVAPLADRLVLFSSTRMLHRVLPSTTPRSCFTIWISQGKTKASDVMLAATAAPPPPPPGAGTVSKNKVTDDMWRFLMQPAVRQHVCKLAYEDEWRLSIKESHPACSKTDAALQRHQEAVATIHRALSNCQPALQMLLDAAETLRQAAEAGEEAEDESGNAAGIRRESGHSNSRDKQLDEAYSLLRRVVPHIRWF